MELKKLSINVRKKSLKYLSQYGTVSYINKNNIRIMNYIVFIYIGNSTKLR